MKLSNKATLVSILITVSLMTGITLAFAYGGDNELIHACVKDNNGDIRIVSANQDCKNNESNLDWRIQGEPGPAGAPGSSGFEIVWDTFSVSPSENTITLACPDNKFAISGGAQLPGDSWLAVSRPVGPEIVGGSGSATMATAWEIGVSNVADGTFDLTAYVVCANIQP